MNNPTVKVHSAKQHNALFSDKKIIALCTGIQWGKSMTGAMWMCRMTYKYCADTDNFIITAPTYKIMEQSTLPAFMRLMSQFGEYNKQQAIFRFRNGGTVYFRTNTQPDSVVGITNVRAIWCDEAGKYTLYFWENIQGRSAFKDCQIMLTSSPYTVNWLFKELVKPVLDNKRDDIALIQASSVENPYFPRAEYERQRATMDTRRFESMYGGNFSRMSGLVYDCLDSDIHLVDSFSLPAGTRYVAGIDWGFTDPFVCVIHAITPNGLRYHISEYYKTQMTITDIIAVLKQKKSVFGIECFYADPSQPGYIEELNRAGLTCVGAKNDIRLGVDTVYQELKMHKFLLFKGHCKFTMDEMENYRYPEPKDLRPDQESKDQLPVGQDDHTMDATRYCVIMTNTLHQLKQPKISDELPKQIDREDHAERIRRLKKGKKQWHQTEKFS